MRGHPSDAMAAVALVDETERADDATRIILDPEMHGGRRGVQRVDVLKCALLLDHEDRLTHSEDSEKRARGQLVEVRRVNLRPAGSCQLATCGVIALVQNEQRRAVIGMTLKHSGHARVVDSTGLLKRAWIRL